MITIINELEIGLLRLSVSCWTALATIESHFKLTRWCLKRFPPNSKEFQWKPLLLTIRAEIFNIGLTEYGLWNMPRLKSRYLILPFLAAEPTIAEKRKKKQRNVSNKRIERVSVNVILARNSKF